MKGFETNILFINWELLKQMQKIVLIKRLQNLYGSNSIDNLTAHSESKISQIIMVQWSTDKLMSLGYQNWHQHIQRSTYPFEKNEDKRRDGGQEEDQYNIKIKLSEFNTRGMYCTCSLCFPPATIPNTLSCTKIHHLQICLSNSHFSAKQGLPPSHV